MIKGHLLILPDSSDESRPSLSPFPLGAHHPLSPFSDRLHGQEPSTHTINRLGHRFQPLEEFFLLRHLIPVSPKDTALNPLSWLSLYILHPLYKFLPQKNKNSPKPLISRGFGDVACIVDAVLRFIAVSKMKSEFGGRTEISLSD